MTEEKKRDWFFYLTLINLFWVGMNCPDLSQGFFFLCTAIMLLFFEQTSEDRIPPIVLGSLLAYLLLHYLSLYFFGFISTFQLIKEPLFLLACYKYGHFMGKKRMKTWPEGILFILLAMVSGFVIFAFLSIYLAPNISMYASQVVGEAKAGRTGIMIWTGKPGGFGPILGIQGNLGTAFLPVLVFGALYEFFQTKKIYFSVLVVGGVLIIFGLYTNILLKNRGPFVIIAGLMGVISLYNMIFGPSRLTPRKICWKSGMLLSGVLVLVLAIQTLPSINDISHLGVVSRFTQEGASSPRSVIWENCIKVISENLLGGRKEFFGHEFAHNIWLDVGYDSGIFAMFFLIIFHVIHFKDFAVILFGRLPIHSGIISAVIAMFSIIFISLFTEPVGKGYTIYYAMTFFFCGLVKRLKTDGENLKKEIIYNEFNNRIHNAGRMQA